MPLDACLENNGLRIEEDEIVIIYCEDIAIYISYLPELTTSLNPHTNQTSVV